MTSLLQIIRVSGYLNIVSAILLLGFWFLFALLMPYGQLSTTLRILVEDPQWTWVNVLGVLGGMTGLLGYIGLHLYYIVAHDRVAVIAFVVGFVGLIIVTAQLLWESFLYPVMLAGTPDLFNFQGPLYASPQFMGVVITGGLLFSAGYIVSGIIFLRADHLAQGSLWLVIIGAPLFGLGAAAGSAQVWVRTVGILLLSAGLIWIGIQLLGVTPIIPES